MEREPAKTFRDLIVWQKAHQFALGAYKLSQNFPREEIYGLTSQFRRAAVFDRSEHSRRVQEERSTRQGAIPKHRAGFFGRMSLLLDPCFGSQLWRYNGIDNSTRGGQSITHQLSQRCRE